MKKINRRQFLQFGAAFSSVLMLPGIVRAQNGQPRVVVVGGGFAGATIAKYLRMWSGNSIDVTLIAPSTAHTSCVLSNLAVTGQVKLSNITFGYDVLAAPYGIKFIQGSVAEILPGDPVGSVLLASGQVIEYDRLVLAPGVSFDPIPGLESDSLLPDEQKLVPHAWVAGAQTTNLQRQLALMPKRGTFIISIPPKPFRAGAGPYERACLVADFLKRSKKGGKVIVLDANPAIVNEPNTFANAFVKTYKGMVEYVPNAVLQSVSFKRTSGVLKRNAIVSINGSTALKTYTGNVLNVIPRNKAGSLLFQSGLGLINVSGRWAGVDPRSYESTVIPRIHIIGDSQGTGQPKAGHMANAQAKVCADAIIRLFGGGLPHPAPVTSMALFSAVSNKSAGWLSAVYQFDPVTGTMAAVPASSGEASAANGDNFQRLFAWAGNLFSDSFM